MGEVTVEGSNLPVHLPSVPLARHLNRDFKTIMLSQPAPNVARPQHSVKGFSMKKRTPVRVRLYEEGILRDVLRD